MLRCRRTELSAATGAPAVAWPTPRSTAAQPGRSDTGCSCSGSPTAISLPPIASTKPAIRIHCPAPHHAGLVHDEHEPALLRGFTPRPARLPGRQRRGPHALQAAKLLRRLARCRAAQNLKPARLPQPRHLAQREGLAGSRIAFYQRQRRRRQHRFRRHPLIRRQAAAGQQTDAGRGRPAAARPGPAIAMSRARISSRCISQGPRRGDVLRLAIGAVLHQTQRRTRCHCLRHQSRKLALRQHHPVPQGGLRYHPW